MQHIILLPHHSKVDPRRVHHTLRTIAGNDLRVNEIIPISYNFPNKHPFSFLPRRLSFRSPTQLQQSVKQMNVKMHSRTIVVAWDHTVFVEQPSITTVLLVPHTRHITPCTFDSLRPNVTVWVDMDMVAADAKEIVREIVKENMIRGRTVFVRIMQDITDKRRFGWKRVWLF